MNNNIKDKRYRIDFFQNNPDYIQNSNIQLCNEDNKYLKLYNTPNYTKKQNSYKMTSHILPSPFIELFFSNQNIQNIQNQIRHQVYLRTNNSIIINEQDFTQIGLVMENIFMQSSNNPTDKSLFKNEIERLNIQVINKCSDIILTNIKGQSAFIKKITSDIIPLENPEFTSIKGSKITKAYSPWT